MRDSRSVILIIWNMLLGELPGRVLGIIPGWMLPMLAGGMLKGVRGCCVTGEGAKLLKLLSPERCGVLVLN